MKVWHLSTDDMSGGAARAAYRLHMAMLQQGVESTMRVLTHNTANDRVIAGKAPRSFSQKVKGRLQQKPSLILETVNSWKNYKKRTVKEQCRCNPTEQERTGKK